MEVRTYVRTYIDSPCFLFPGFPLKSLFLVDVPLYIINTLVKRRRLGCLQFFSKKNFSRSVRAKGRIDSSEERISSSEWQVSLVRLPYLYSFYKG